MKAWLPESNYTAIKSNQWSGSLSWRRGSRKGCLWQLILEKLKCPVSSAVWGAFSQSGSSIAGNLNEAGIKLFPVLPAPRWGCGIPTLLPGLSPEFHQSVFRGI